MILLLKSYPYHFVHTILSVPFCPIPFCPYIILSIPFGPYHFVRYHFVQYHFVRIPFCPYTILSVPFCPLPFCPVTDVIGHENQSQHYMDHRCLCLELSGRITTPDGFSYHNGP